MATDETGEKDERDQVLTNEKGCSNLKRPRVVWKSECGLEEAVRSDFLSKTVRATGSKNRRPMQGEMIPGREHRRTKSTENTAKLTGGKE